MVAKARWLFFWRKLSRQGLCCDYRCCRMSINFTGSTGRRSINLGNRNLKQKNKAVFLKTAQAEREKRELIRRENTAAIVIQSACRHYLDLYNWRVLLSKTWDGSSITEFKYFFPFLASVNSEDVILNQLESIKSNLGLYTDDQKNVIFNVLINTIINISYNYQQKNHNILITMLEMLEQIHNETNSIVITRGLEFTKSLVDLFHHNKSLIHFIFVLSDKLVTEVLFEVLLTLDTNLISDIEEMGRIMEFGQFISFLLVTTPKERYINLTTIHKISLLYYISSSFFSYNQLSEYKNQLYDTLFNVLYILMSSLTNHIEIDSLAKNNASRTENRINTDLYINGNRIHISNTVFNVIKQLFFNFVFDANNNIQSLINFIAASLHFISLINDEMTQTLKVHIDMKWLLTNETLIKTCYHNSVGVITKNEYTQGKETLIKMLNTAEYEQWWNCLSVLQESLIATFSITPHGKVINNIMITKNELEEIGFFYRWFCTEILLNYRHFPKPEQYLKKRFLQLFKKSLTLLHALYTYSSTDGIFDKEFWIAFIDFSPIDEYIPLIDNLHHELARIQLTESDDDSTDFLESSKLLSLNKTIPKRVYDLLTLLTYAPFMAPFEQRALFFSNFIAHDKKENNYGDWVSNKPQGIIKRDNIFLSAYASFGNLTGLQFKNPFSVQFINQFGEMEAGIDGGGLTKELLTTLVPASFMPSQKNREENKGLQFFQQGTDYKLYCNSEFFFKLQYQKQNPSIEIPYAVSNEGYLKMMRFLGMVLGKCLYENILLDVSFTNFFLNSICKMGGRFFRNLMGDRINFYISTNSFDELEEIDESLYNGLNFILREQNDKIFSEMHLTCSVTDEFEDINGKQYKSEIILIPSKENPSIPAFVTNKNKMQYIRMLTYFKLMKQSDLVMKYFVEGLFQVIQPHWLLFFSPDELQTLIIGTNSKINIKDLFDNSVLNNYSKDDKTIIDLFSILTEFSEDDKSKFIKFVTSSSKQPLCGFGELNPKFAINRAGNDTGRLPTASTCMNLLKLPDYKDKELLRKKLLYSINSNAGFDLS